MYHEMMKKMLKYDQETYFADNGYFSVTVVTQLFA